MLKISVSLEKDWARRVWSEDSEGRERRPSWICNGESEASMLAVGETNVSMHHEEQIGWGIGKRTLASEGLEVGHADDDIIELLRIKVKVTSTILKESEDKRERYM